jgi:hypothetical protein
MKVVTWGAPVISPLVGVSLRSPIKKISCRCALWVSLEMVPCGQVTRRGSIGAHSRSGYPGGGHLRWSPGYPLKEVFLVGSLEVFP